MCQILCFFVCDEIQFDLDYVIVFISFDDFLKLVVFEGVFVLEVCGWLGIYYVFVGYLGQIIYYGIMFDVEDLQ